MSFSDLGTGATAEQVDPLVVADLAADEHLRPHVGVLDGDDAQPDLAVVDEDRVAGVHVAGAALVRRAGDADVAGDVAGGDRPLLPAAQRDRALGERRQTDLGPCRSAKMPTPCPLTSDASRTSR